MFPAFDGNKWYRGESLLVVLSTQDPLPYQRLRHWMSKLLAPLHNMSLKEFQSKFGMKSFRSGRASAAGAANIPFEVGGSHGLAVEGGPTTLHGDRPCSCLLP